jgi:uncharacterized transporter YbjL
MPSVFLATMVGIVVGVVSFVTIPLTGWSVLMALGFAFGTAVVALILSLAWVALQPSAGHQYYEDE